MAIILASRKFGWKDFIAYQEGVIMWTKPNYHSTKAGRRVLKLRALLSLLDMGILIVLYVLYGLLPLGRRGGNGTENVKGYENRS